MFKNADNLFYKRKKTIEDEILLKLKIDKVLSRFIKEQIVKKTDLDCNLSYTLNKGIVKLETDSKVVAQEIALRIKRLEDDLRREGVFFRKVLI